MHWSYPWVYKRKGNCGIQMAVGLSNVASLVTTSLCTIVNLFVIVLSIFTSLITNYTSLPASENEPSTVDSLVTNEPSNAVFDHIPFRQTHGNTRKDFHVSCPVSLFFYFGYISYHFNLQKLLRWIFLVRILYHFLYVHLYIFLPCEYSFCWSILLICMVSTPCVVHCPSLSCLCDLCILCSIFLRREFKMDFKKCVL